MSDYIHTNTSAQAPKNPYLINIQWGRFSCQIKDSPWSLAALTLTMLCCAAIAWAIVAIWA